MLRGMNSRRMKKSLLWINWHRYVTPRLKAVDSSINFSSLDPDTVNQIVAGLVGQDNEEQAEESAESTE